MIVALLAVLLSSTAGAAVPAVQPSTGTAAPAAPALGVSTYTVSTLYTGDRVRDPFLPPSAGGARERAPERAAGTGVDIHSLQLRGIMKDSKTDFALFATETGATVVLRGGRLYDERGKIAPGITGRIRIRQRRVDLITADKDVQVFALGGDEEKDQDKP